MLELFTSETRLYSLAWHDDNGPEMAVEAWWGREELSGGFEYILDLLTTDAYLPDDQLIGRVVTLSTTLSDGTQYKRSGCVRSVLALGSDGGFGRYRLIIVPWIWFATRGAQNRVFQEKTVIEIVDAVFADYAQLAAWRWSDEVAPFMADTRQRSYCVQHNESDFALITRLLTEEGLSWRIEADDQAPAGHRVTIFADSRDLPEDVLSQSANGGRGIRYHRADSQEEQDAVLAFGEQRQLLSGMTTVLTWDYKAKKSIATSVPTALALGGQHAPRLEAYDDAGPYAFANRTEAERYGRLAMEALEARYRTWLGRGTVRSLTAGTRLDLVGLPINPAKPEADHRYVITSVHHVGINNLSAETMAALARRFKERQFIGFPDDLAGGIHDIVHAPDTVPSDLLALALERGYANSFAALHADTPWRARLVDDTGARLNPRPTAPRPDERHRRRPER